MNAEPVTQQRRIRYLAAAILVFLAQSPPRRSIQTILICQFPGDFLVLLSRT